MRAAPPLRIAILAHSTNPRGGVVHALELSDALVRLGHDVVVHAPDASGRGFFRHMRCEAVAFPVGKAPADVTTMVKARIDDYLGYFSACASRRFDVYHAQDGISGNALARMAELGWIEGFLRTVHHIDDFADPELQLLQTKAIVAASAHFVVSDLWRRRLSARFDLRAEIVGNGVDTTRFTPLADGREASLRHRLYLGAGPVFLAVGGIEERKNTQQILEAFLRLRARLPGAQLIIAGGATLLNHDAYQAAFARVLSDAALPQRTVILAGPMADDDMPALYRLADAVVFPSIREGFGLVALEAMASGAPVVLSRIAPFTEYLDADDAAWCDPDDAQSIEAAMLETLSEPRRGRLIMQGMAVAYRHTWDATARAHLETYERVRKAHKAHYA